MNTTTKKNKIPLRRCILTGEKLEKKHLLRLVRTPDGVLTIDPTGKLNGRGAYVKKDIHLVERLQSSRLLIKHLGVQPDDTFYAHLREVLGG
jgi:hypothetical protein